MEIMRRMARSLPAFEEFLVQFRKTKAEPSEDYYSRISNILAQIYADIIYFCHSKQKCNLFQTLRRSSSTPPGSGNGRGSRAASISAMGKIRPYRTAALKSSTDLKVQTKRSLNFKIEYKHQHELQALSMLMIVALLTMEIGS